MKLETNEKSDLTNDRTMGFVKIKEKEQAQQVTVSTKLLSKAIRLLESMEKMGFEETTITIQDGQPVILGGKTMGIGIAPRNKE